MLFNERPQDVSENRSKEFRPGDKIAANIVATGLLHDIAAYTSFQGGSTADLSTSRMVLIRYYHPDLEKAANADSKSLFSK